MDAVKAILSRHSVRDFRTDKAPAKNTIMKIMETAIYSPSGGNSQPWEVFIAAGSTIEKIRSVYKERYEKGEMPARTPPEQPDYIKERMGAIRKGRMELLGLDPADPGSGKIFMEWVSVMFNAPVVAVICIDKVLSSTTDLGLFMQSVCISARNYKVDTFIAGQFVTHEDVIRRELDIPENLNIIAGIGLGYANKNSVINSYRSPRRPVDEVVRYRG